jgi:8-oxo-dGTP pyrophosphatase MutT (NUDIX family)
MFSRMLTRPPQLVPLFVNFHQKCSSFPGGKVDSTDESALNAALGGAREEAGIVADRIKILGRLSPPMPSLGGLRVWPYVVSPKRCAHDPIKQRR